MKKPLPKNNNMNFISVVQLSWPAVNLSIFRGAGLTQAKVTDIDSRRESPLAKYDTAMAEIGSHGKSHTYLTFYIKAPCNVFVNYINYFNGHPVSLTTKELGLLVEAVVTTTVDAWESIVKHEGDPYVEFIQKSIRKALNDLYPTNHFPAQRKAISNDNTNRG